MNTPNDDRALSFSIENLRDAGSRIGPIRSKLTPPKTTFEDLARRADQLLARVIDREQRRG